MRKSFESPLYKVIKRLTEFDTMKRIYTTSQQIYFIQNQFIELKQYLNNYNTVADFMIDNYFQYTNDASDGIKKIKFIKNKIKRLLSNDVGSFTTFNNVLQLKTELIEQIKNHSNDLFDDITNGKILFDLH